MILMALDHVREYFGPATNPTDLTRTTAGLFFTRWVTHFCAPVFFLLVGAGVSLARRKRPAVYMSRFLFARGIWLVLAELVVVRWIMQFNFDYRATIVTVFWTIGWSMVALAVLVYLPAPIVAAAGILMIVASDALAGQRSVLISPGVIFSDADHIVFAAYPLVPWLGVAAAGYGLGSMYGWSPARRQAILWVLGIVLTGGFIALRTANVYGDPVPWLRQSSIWFTALSFLNTNKYPPSLLFLMMTLGPALLVLAATDRRVPGMLRSAGIFGQVPFFYFLLHLLAIHLLAVIVCYLRYGDAHWMVQSPSLDRFPFTRPPDWGFGLPVLYSIWAGIVAALYPVCRWYAGVKERHGGGWLRFL